MPNQQKLFSPGYRKRKAYSTAFRVFMSYFWLYLKSKILGQQYYARKIKDLHLKNADRIKVRVQELQGLFIKIGQLISNLSNVLPEEFRGPLEELQDHVQPKPYAEIEATIEQQLGRKPTEVFSQFSKEALAAASIGQVHRAEIDGQQVAVKIQHQHIDVIASADLEILKNLVRLHGFFMNMQGLDHTYEQVRQMIQEELDYQKEAQAMQRIAENLVDSPELRVKIPRVYSEYSTTKVLTSEFCEGSAIGQIQQLKTWELDLEDIAKRLIELYCKMILVDGFYHADPHPGNILVDQTGTLVLLDFGAVAYVSEQTKTAIPELIEAVIRTDTEAIVGALKKMGFLGPDKASRQYVEKLIEMFKEFLQNEVEFDGLNFQNIKLNSGLSSLTSLISKVDLREVSNTIRIPKDYILLNRTIVLLSGDAFLLAPTLNAIDVVRPYMKKHVLNKNNGFSKLIINTFKNQLTAAVSLPNELSQFLKTAKESDLEMEIAGVKEGLQKIYHLGQQFLYIFVLIATAFFTMNYGFSENTGLRNLHWTIIAIPTFLLLRSIYRDMKK